MEADMNTRTCLLASMLALSACDGAGDPYQRPGTWKLTYANDANLRVMVADPGDLVHGRGDGLAFGETAAAAVRRLRQGRVKDLPDSGVAQVKLAGSGATSPGLAADGTAP
jgi:hypothetical protein